jgi:hypothetical protein
MTEYSFCESTLASSVSRWHIRKLSDKGRKLGGGIDTQSLCERLQPSGMGHGFGGWDLSVELDEHGLKGACPTCVEKYLEETKAV